MSTPPATANRQIAARLLGAFSIPPDSALVRVVESAEGRSLHPLLELE